MEFKRFLRTEDGYPAAAVVSEGMVRYFHFAGNLPVLLSVSDIICPRAIKISEEEFFKTANPEAIASLKNLLG